jgi:hypothetical protein
MEGCKIAEVLLNHGELDLNRKMAILSVPSKLDSFAINERMGFMAS